jgi:hypothetical protein
LDFFRSQSSSTVNFPILACSGSQTLSRLTSSAPAATLPALAKTHDAPSNSFFFHSETCTGCRSKSFAIG